MVFTGEPDEKGCNGLAKTSSLIRRERERLDYSIMFDYNYCRFNRCYYSSNASFIIQRL